MAIVYTCNEERVNSITHAIGALMLLSACVILIYRIDSVVSTEAVLGISLYAFGGGASYIASAIYHSVSSKSRFKERLRKLDHAAIYWHIAGSYSPVVLYGMSQYNEWGVAIFIFVWMCAVVGSFYSFRKLREHSNLETACFVCMGLVVLLVFDKVLECLGWDVMKWIILEGSAFIAGALFYSFNKIPYMHSVFHVFVLAGTTFHIIALYKMM